MKKREQNAAADFEARYAAIYGERWPSLRAALESDDADYETVSFPPRAPYALNSASADAARILNVSPGDTVLDLCAAPGGKTVILAAALNGCGRLVANDLSMERRRRLKTVIKTVLPPEIAQTVTVTGREAALIGRSEPECYDRVLADVPCSAEAHLLRRPQELERWSPARVKSLALRQFAILVSGLDALKIGGELLYSTCSIAPEENDGVIAKLLKKRPHAVELIPFASPGEATEFGRIVLPDTERGRGPLYLCKLRKTASSQKPRQ